MPRKPKTYPELDALRDLMGNRPDHEIAAIAGTSASIVGRYRRKYDIAPYEGYKFGMREGQGENADPEGAGGEPAATRARHPEPKEQEGEMRTTGSSWSGASGDAGTSASRRRSKLDPFFDILGQVPDAEVAAMAQVTPENVRAFRRRHGIEAEWRAGPGRADAPAPAAVPAPAALAAPPTERAVEIRVASPGGELQGYAISVKGAPEEYLIVSTDIASAAATAIAAIGRQLPSAQVVAIRHLGPAIG